MTQNINERDIFNFVFSPELLTSGQKSKINQHGEYANLISFYQEIKNTMNEELPEEIKNLIAEKIAIYRPVRTINLFPAENIDEKKNYVLPVLAAASAIETDVNYSQTFIDSNKEFLVRLINIGNKSKIYVFATNNEIVKNFKLKISPSGKSFSMADNSSPLELETVQKIDGVEIELV